MLVRRLASPLMMFPLVALCAVSLGGCAPDQAGEALLDGAMGSLGEPISGGYLDEGDKNVVGILFDDGYEQGACTGSLIASNVVLTAQHCVAPVLNSVQGGVQCGVTTFGGPYAASQMFVHTETEFPWSESGYHRVREISIPPGGDTFCGRDLAIIILEGAIDPAEAVPLVPRVDVALTTGELYSAIGFGQTYDDPYAPSGTRYRRDGLTVQCVGEQCPSYAVTPSEFMGETGICSGDSGGPAIDTAWRVTGVTSRGAAACESPVYGHVANWADWIKERTTYGQSLIGATPPPWSTGWPTDPAYSYPVGPPCEVVENCSSGFCLDNYCTRLCSPAAPCPEGYECTADTSLCQAIPPKKKKKSSTDDGCAISEGRAADPTQPTPWVIIAAVLSALGLRRRRRR